MIYRNLPLPIRIIRLITISILLSANSAGISTAQEGSPSSPDFSAYENKFAWDVPAELVERLSSRRANNFDESKVPEYILPDIFTLSGETITNRMDWEQTRREELLDLFRREVYGYAPPRPDNLAFRIVESNEDALGGMATLKIVEISFSLQDKPFSFHLTLFTPNENSGKSPAFLLLNHRAPENTDPSRLTISNFWPAEYAISRGYAIAAVNVAAEVDPDKPESTTGIRAFYKKYYPEPESLTWGTIAAWAWAGLRGMDYLETDPDINSEQVAVIGHSRGGKTSLWAGAQDTRIALTCPNNAGEGGPALSHRLFGEYVSNLNSRFPHWFTDNYNAYSGKELSMPFDQHMVVALVAPRAYHGGDATSDLWADPRGSWLSLTEASKVWEMYGSGEALKDKMPLVNDLLVHGPIAYHMREGGHNLGIFDWKLYMDHADILFSHQNPASAIFCKPIMVGEVGQSTAIFQSRLCATDSMIYSDIHTAEGIFQADIPGKKGFARFEISTEPSFENSINTEWMESNESSDFIIKCKVTELQAGTEYYYRLHYGLSKSDTKNSDTKTSQTSTSQTNTSDPKTSRTNTFRTLSPVDSRTASSFVMVTGTNLERFYLGGGFGKSSSQGTEAYMKEDKYEGFPGLKTIAGMKPDFYIGNGDNVYYDQPSSHRSRSQKELRAEWHRKFAMPRMQDMLEDVPAYWIKDDHDHRFDDSDTVNANKKFGPLPSHQLGVETFLEQVPVVDPEEENPVTYRTVRINALMQIWMVEGRDYRSPNKMEDGPEKSIWGETQMNWLKSTLKESDAVFKILVTPTPMVGPDGASKIDNHTNLDGFRHEGDEFFQWLKKNKFLKKNFYIICGDRHWQYHAIHPTGFEEFSCGALVDQNSRMGVDPGAPKSTDPKGKIKQPYTSAVPSGGFLKVNVNPGDNGGDENISFIFYDENGTELYRETKKSQ